MKALAAWGFVCRPAKENFFQFFLYKIWSRQFSSFWVWFLKGPWILSLKLDQLPFEWEVLMYNTTDKCNKKQPEIFQEIFVFMTWRVILHPMTNRVKCAKKREIFPDFSKTFCCFCPPRHHIIISISMKIMTNCHKP